MVYDGDCGFCKFWIHRWAHRTGSRVDYISSQELQATKRYPEIPAGDFATSVQLIGVDGEVVHGAEAVFRAFALTPHGQWPLNLYVALPAFEHVTEWAYALVARHRRFFSFLTRLGWGSEASPPTHLLTRKLFLRAIGFIYLVAFVSLWTQIIGLVGSDGIVPARTTMASVQAGCDAQQIGVNRYHLFPTLCWANTSDGFLKGQCVAGTALALLVILGIAPAPCLFLLWVIYLSLSTIGVEFLGFQWDILLLETGFLAIFFAPLHLWPFKRIEAPPSRAILFLFHWLLFRLMFESGCVKLLSHDPLWRHLTALDVHYETQPLPTWIGWYAHQLPETIQRACVAIMFVIELGVPFLIFAPRRLRHAGAWVLIALQIAILLTGNYCFFNLLTIALCLLLFDDAALRKLIPSRWRKTNDAVSDGTSSPMTRAPIRWPIFVTWPLTMVVMMISGIQVLAMFGLNGRWFPEPIPTAYGWLEPFRTINHYGLFAVMTPTRPEIIVEGSNDGVRWEAYEFRYKAGDVDRRPRFVEPHQPRLDWQMWFAALGDYRQERWFVNFCERLLEGSPPVLGLLEKNPFPDAPPRYVRALVYEYHFTDFATRRRTGAWWRRELKGVYMPPMALPETR